ncbi:MAG: fluoride efflux transporter CrcB [Chloroflexota bacterium]|nr:fluoride efflux transporter CrcB [Chloroflexota bacterium]
MRFLLVGLGGFLGANARYILSGWVSSVWPGAFPLGTFLVNVTGSFVLGFFTALVVGRLHAPEEYRLFVAIGFLGSYTTFSTLSYETLDLLRRGEFLTAALYSLGSLVLGLLAAGLGVALGR